MRTRRPSRERSVAGAGEVARTGSMAASWTAVTLCGLMLGSAASARAQTVPLEYTDDLSSYSVYWFRGPSGATVADSQPVGLVLPPFTGDEQIYGQIPLGDSADPDFDFVADLFGLGEDLEEIDFYFDRNKNGDLTDDGGPLLLPSLSSDKVESFDVPYQDGTAQPYS